MNSGNHNSVIHPLFSNDQSADNTTTSILDNYPGSIVDPSNVIFSALNCEQDLNKGIKKTYIDISYSSDTKYNDIKTQKHLNGFNYPTIIKL